MDGQLESDTNQHKKMTPKTVGEKRESKSGVAINIA